MSAAVTSVMFYYGSTLPRQAATARLAGVRVVLQPYHPLLAAGRFDGYFPGGSLFVYWNPAGVPPADLAAAAEPVPTLGIDPVWRLARLDLRRAAARRFAVGRGLAALRSAGTQAAGLFVDDLDLWTSAGRQAAALRTVRALLAGAGREVALFVNRGFALWPRLPGLDAALLEEITPGLVDRMAGPDADWVGRCVLPAVRQARAGGTAIFGLSYDPAPESTPARPAAAELAALCDAVVHGNRSLDIWPEDVR